MKLVQKTILATAVAVAFSPAAFADVTLKGKVSAEIAHTQHLDYAEKQNGTRMLSDGLDVDLKGKYDIAGGLEAGFATNLNVNGTWGRPAKGKQSVTLDKANLFIEGGFGNLTFGRVTLPSGNIENDVWGNSAIATQTNYTGSIGSANNAIVYTFENDMFEAGFGISAQNPAGRDGGASYKKSGGQVSKPEQLISDVAVAVNVGPATLKAGTQYQPYVKKGGLISQIGADVDLGALDLTTSISHDTVSTGAEKHTTDLLAGVSYDVTDSITAKLSTSVGNITGKKPKGSKAVTPVQVAVGADFSLADNVTAFTAVDVETAGDDDKKKKSQVGFTTGFEVKF